MKKYEVIQIIISVISTIIVLATLLEMQKARDAAYRPDVVLKTTEIAFQHISSVDESSLNNQNNNTIWNVSPQIEILNVGMETAKNVYIEWNNEDNINQLQTYLKNHSNVNLELSECAFTLISTESQIVCCSSPVPTKFEYIPSYGQEQYFVQFPDIYYYSLMVLSKHRPLLEYDINLSLSISYEDIQGKSYSKIINLQPELLNYSKNRFGSYTIIFTKEKDTMNILNLDNDTLVALSSFLAVLVSGLSMVFSIIFSKLQIKHNKNSVKPIATISVSDYENLLSVNISNAGTGPLTITKFIASTSTTEANTLIELMPNIKQYWSTFEEQIEGTTVPINGTITLVEITPKNDETKKIVRHSLSQITINMEYIDIYNTKFTKIKKLDFFGRHLDKS